MKTATLTSHDGKLLTIERVILGPGVWKFFVVKGPLISDSSGNYSQCLVLTPDSEDYLQEIDIEQLLESFAGDYVTMPMPYERDRVPAPKGWHWDDEGSQN